MENIFMRFCRETHNHTLNAMATHLGITTSEYLEIESGRILLSEGRGQLLGKLFNVKSDYFYEAAEQLDLLLARNEMVKILKEKNQQLNQQLRDLKNAAINKR